MKFDITKRHPECTDGGHSFFDDGQCYTLIWPSPDGWTREDLCQSCWLKKKKEGLTKGVKSHWQSTLSKKQQKERPPQKKLDIALSALKSALAQGSLINDQIAFVLALYLARKKVLRLRQEVEEAECVVQLYELLQTEELLPVKKLNLHAHEVNDVQEKLAEILMNPI